MTLIAKSAASGIAFATALVIDHQLLIPLGSVLTVGSGIWWFGRKLQRIDDRMERMEEKLAELPCQPPKKPSDCDL